VLNGALSLPLGHEVSMSFLAETWLFWSLFLLGLFLFWQARRSLVGQFLFERFLLALFTLLLVSIVIFVIMEAVPGDCATRMIAYKNTQGTFITDADIQAERSLRGLDGVVYERWGKWFYGLFTKGDLGFSCEKRAPVQQVLGNRFLISLAVCVLGLLFAYSLAVPLGVISAIIMTQPIIDYDPQHSAGEKLGRSLVLISSKIFETLLRIVSYLGLALPNFLIALGIIVFYIQLDLNAPIGLLSEEFRDQTWWLEEGFNAPKFLDFLWHFWLPVFTLGWSATALQLQTVRALTIDEANKLYVTAARARGLGGTSLWIRYPVRHSIGPLVNSVGFDLNRIFNDLPIVASIILLTDAGQLLLTALAFTNDQELASSILFLITLTIVVVNFLSDVLLALFDPRIQRSILKGG
jgi:peptide/nickel transport system permease protein